jgi:hypothetical protein
VTFQRSVAGCPAVISAGLAEKATIVGTLEVVVSLVVDVVLQAGKLSARPLIRNNSKPNKNTFFISTS